MASTPASSPTPAASPPVGAPTAGAPYWNSYAAGVALGILLFASFYMTGNGLGASGALARLVVAAQEVVMPHHVDTTPALASMGGGDKWALDHWLVIEILGVVIGGFASSMLRGRFRFETLRGPLLSPGGRWALAFVGGSVMGFGARVARGCTSGQALSGGALLSAGSWAFMLCVFAGGYAVAWFMRRLWLEKT